MGKKRGAILALTSVVVATLMPHMGGAMLPTERTLREVAQRRPVLAPKQKLSARKPTSTRIQRSGTAPFAGNLSPSWMSQSPSTYMNDSFLSDQDLTSTGWSPLSQRDLIEANDLQGMRFDYGRKMNLDLYHRRSSAGIGNSPDEERVRIDQVREFSRGIFQGVSRHQTRKARSTLRRAAERDPNLRSEPVVVAGTIVSIYFDNPVLFSVSEAKISARTNIPNQTGNVSMSSPLFDGSFELDGRAADGLAPGAVPIDPTWKREKYRFSMSRPVGLLDITSGVTYGSTTTQLSASLSKPLNSNMTCVVDSVRPLDAPGAVAEERVKLLYGINF